MMKLMSAALVPLLFLICPALAETPAHELQASGLIGVWSQSQQGCRQQGEYREYRVEPDGMASEIRAIQNAGRPDVITISLDRVISVEKSGGDQIKISTAQSYCPQRITSLKESDPDQRSLDALKETCKDDAALRSCGCQPSVAYEEVIKLQGSQIRVMAAKVGPHCVFFVSGCTIKEGRVVNDGLYVDGAKSNEKTESLAKCK
jgi:hypothetical protein